MRRIWIFCLFLGLVQSIEARQWLVFFAKEGVFDGVIRQSFGHAYVALIREDPLTGQKIAYGCWGFYPEGGIEGRGFWGFMNGEIRNDWKNYMDHGYTVEISEHEFLAGLQLHNAWINHRYSLRAVNCLHFVMDYVRLIPKLKMPKGKFILPSSYLKALRAANKDVEYKGDIKNVIHRPSLWREGLHKKFVHIGRITSR